MASLTGAMLFWVLIVLMTGLAYAFVLPSLLRRPRMHRGISRAEANTAIYRSQLAELDQGLAAGVLSAIEHRQSADDVLRNALAGEHDQPLPDKTTPHRALAFAVALAFPALAVAIYLCVGNPAALSRGEPIDLLALDAGVSRAAIPGWIEQLERHLAHNPRDGRGWVTLGRLHLELDRYDAAARAYEHGIGISQKIAQDPQVLCELADALGMAQGGSLKGKPRELIDQALALKGTHPRALEMAGSAEYEAGNLQSVLAHWEPLLAQLPPGSLAQRELSAAVERTRSLVARADMLATR